MYGPWARNHTRARSVLSKSSHSSPQGPGLGITLDPIGSCLYIFDATLIGTRISFFVFGLGITLDPIGSCLYIFDATLIGTRISFFVFEMGRPDGPFDPAVARSSELLGSNPGRVGC